MQESRYEHENPGEINGNIYMILFVLVEHNLQSYRLINMHLYLFIDGPKTTSIEAKTTSIEALTMIF